MSKNSEMIERLEYLMSGSRVVLNEREKEAVQYGIDAIQSLSRYFELTKILESYFNDIQEQTEHVSEILDNSPLIKKNKEENQDIISQCPNCNYYCYYYKKECPKCNSTMRIILK
jgi:ssDNA-binding Zn-finger/Zn-ribbon topoisomerase 1